MVLSFLYFKYSKSIKIIMINSILKLFTRRKVERNCCYCKKPFISKEYKKLFGSTGILMTGLHPYFWTVS